MRFRMDQLLHSLSTGLDAVESELLDVTTNHSKRVAILTTAMGHHLGLDDGELTSLVACSLLHDNALGEHIYAIKLDRSQRESYQPHCIRGENNALYLPFPTDATGIIKYHHEYRDRSGPFEMDAERTPLGAQLLALAEDLDVNHDFHLPFQVDAASLQKKVLDKKGGFYTHRSVDALLAVLDEELIASLQDDRVHETFDRVMPVWIVEKHPSELLDIARIVAATTDYKSKFTAKHTIQIANRAYWMAAFYGYDRDLCSKIYIAASLHDIGKLLIPTAILEKDDELNEAEYSTIKEHVHWTFMMLKDVEGLEEICRWASSHHRKLDGTGYPDLPDDYLNLDFVSRLLACIDVYQAVRETRPYHAGRTHRETMDIMWDMVRRGKIDKEITQSLDEEMARFQTGDGDVPAPEHLS